MFGRRERHGRGLYDDQTMSHPAHGGFSIWQRNLLRSTGDELRADAADNLEYPGTSRLVSGDDAEPDGKQREDQAREKSERTGRSRTIWEEQEEARRRAGRDENETDPAGNPLA